MFPKRKTKERSKVNYLNTHLEKLEKEEQTKSKTKRRKEIINISKDINTLENSKTLQIFNVTIFGSSTDEQNWYSFS